MWAALKSMLLPRRSMSSFVRHYTWLTECVRNVKWNVEDGVTCLVVPYGSLITGLALADADADYALLFLSPPSSVSNPQTLLYGNDTVALRIMTREEQVSALQLLDQHMHAWSKRCTSKDETNSFTFDRYTSQCILRARTPFVQCAVHGANADSDTVVRYDITISPYGVLNSHFIAEYLLRSARLRVGALLLKIWSHRAGLDDSRHGWLSSYAFTVMYIYFLLHTGRLDGRVDEQVSMQQVLSRLTANNPAAQGTLRGPFAPPLCEQDVELVWKDSVDDVRTFFEFYSNDTLFDLDEQVVDIRCHESLGYREQWLSMVSSSVATSEHFALLGHAVMLIRDLYEPHNLARGVDFFRVEAIREAFRCAATKKDLARYLLRP